MLKLSPWTCRTFAAALALSVAAPASAQRRIVGDDDEEEAVDEDAEDAKAAEAKKKKAEEDAKKREEADKAKDEKRRKADEEREKARAAAERAAEEAEKKKKAEEERKQQEKVEKENQRLETNRAARLQQAKKARRYLRTNGKLQSALSMTPGAPKKDAVVELRLDLTKHLDVPSPRFGDFEPLPKAKLVATVKGPETGRGEVESTRYRLRALQAPGTYGLHFTPLVDGEHTVHVVGTTADGADVDFELSVFVDVWPPPDLDDEDAKVRTTESTGRSGRRVAGGGDD